MAASSTEGSLPRVSTSSSTRGTRIGIWLSTGLFGLMFAASGAMFLIAPADIVTNFRHLGYPDYFRQLLGVAKLLGVAALVLPPPSAVLREWAYAGFAFTCVGAATSHVMSGDAAGKAMGPLFALGLLMTSYLLRRRVSRDDASS